MSQKQLQENMEKPVTGMFQHKNPILIDNDNNTRLHYASASGNTEEVKNYLRNESKIVDVENFLGWTPLMMACRRGHMETVNVLLEHGANATKKNHYDMNVLLITIASGNLALVQIILEHLLTGGISRRRLQGMLSPISVAILFQHREIWEYLLTREFDLNASTKITAVTPLMFATAMENSKAFMELLRAGSDGTLKNCVGHTAFDIATLRKNLRNYANRHQQNQQYQQNPQIQQNHQSQQNQQSQQNIPNIIIQSPNVVSNIPNQPQVPFFIISPQPSYFQVASPFFGPNLHLRKSSNVSPFCAPAPPNVTPITPAQQVFFPPEFSPSHIFAQAQSYLDSSNILNGRLNSASDMFLSPQLVNYASPCS